MSRTTSDRITVQPSNNMYTALVAVAIAVVAAGIIILFVRAGTVFPADMSLLK